MKKNYTRPVVEVSAFDFEDVVMASGTSNSMNSENYAGKKDEFIQAAGGGIVVEW